MQQKDATMKDLMQQKDETKKDLMEQRKMQQTK